MKNNNTQINIQLDANDLSTFKTLRLVISMLSKPVIYAVASHSFYDGADGCSFIIDAHGDNPECQVFIDYESMYRAVYSLPCMALRDLRKEMRMSGVISSDDPLYRFEALASWVVPEKFNTLLSVYPQHAPRFVGDFDIVTVIKFATRFGLPSWYFKDKINEPLFAVLMVLAALADAARLLFFSYADLPDDVCVPRMVHAFATCRSMDVMWEAGGWRQCKASREADLNSVLTRALSDRLNQLIQTLFTCPMPSPAVHMNVEYYLSTHGSIATRLPSERREIALVMSTVIIIMLLWQFDLQVGAPVGAVLDLAIGGAD